MRRREVCKSIDFFPKTISSVLWLAGRGADVQQEMKLAQERKAEPECAVPNGRIKEESQRQSMLRPLKFIQYWMGCKGKYFL